MDILTLVPTLVALVLFVASVAVARRNHRLQREVLSDTLTGVANRRAFERCRIDLDGCSPVSVVMVDLDNFKELNDVLGHGAGDGVLVRIAQVMSQFAAAVFGDRAHVFRLGGDEFLLVFEQTDTLHTTALMERIRQGSVECLDPQERIVTMSCGIAGSPDHADTLDDLVGYADRALYQAKRSGRSRTVIYSHDILRDPSTVTETAMLRSIADVLANAVDAKDAYTHAHSRNVADLSFYLAREMGLSSDDVDEITLAGLLHDVGKIGVSDAVLHKPGRLDAQEWEEIKRHCEIGYTILAGIDGAQQVREMVLCHHERMDGAGYPNGICGDDIPVGSRIIAVADAFDSMTAERVYSLALSPEEAIAEIIALSGSQFHPDVVSAMCSLMVFEPPKPHSRTIHDVDPIELQRRAA